MSETFPDEDRCADPIDHASLVETRLRENDVAIARSKSAPEQEQVKGADGVLYWPITECIDCGDEIPEKRLQLAKVRCIYCQEKLEKSRRLHG
jgi:RNA polymerase-binding transcription factor DksA